MKYIVSFVLMLALAGNAFAWGNGGKSSKLSSPKFGTHDWIAYQAYAFASQEADLGWLKNNLNAYFLGTEAPDVGALAAIKAGPGYKDTSSCHCILFYKNGKVSNTRAAKRAQQEYDKAKKALAVKDYRRAAFYLGAMAHYIGDLSQFMHLMGKKSHWGSEDQKIHSRYEKVIDASISADDRTSSILDKYVKKISIKGNTATDVATAVAIYDETGNNTSRMPGPLYDEYKSYIPLGNADDADEWDDDFLDQTGNNVNASINGIAKLLVMVTK